MRGYKLLFIIDQTWPRDYFALLNNSPLSEAKLYYLTNDRIFNC